MARVAGAALLALAGDVMGVLFVIIVAAVGVAMALSVTMSMPVSVSTVSFKHLCNSLGTILDHALKSLDTVHEGVVVDSDSLALTGKSDNCDDEGGEEAHFNENLCRFCFLDYKENQ